MWKPFWTAKKEFLVGSCTTTRKPPPLSGHALMGYDLIHWSTTRWAKKTHFRTWKMVNNDFAHRAPGKITFEKRPQNLTLPKEIPKDKLLVKRPGVSSRGMWMRSQNGGWKTIRLPFGFRYIFRGELLNSQVGISVGCPHVTPRCFGGWKSERSPVKPIF